VIDERVSLAAAIVDVLGYVNSALMAFGAEDSASSVDVVWMGTGGTVRGVTGKGFHHIGLVIPGQARVCRGGSKAHLTLI